MKEVAGYVFLLHTRTDVGGRGIVVSATLCRPSLEPQDISEVDRWSGRLTVYDCYRLAPYERRVIELLRNSKDKRARKLAKKRVCHRIILHPGHYNTILQQEHIGTGLKLERMI